jgi:hypothetical protein
MENELFYNIRHLKTFKDITKNSKTVWAYRYPNNRQIEVYDKNTGNILFMFGHDLQFAEYVCTLHNMSGRLIKEVESKYE